MSPLFSRGRHQLPSDSGPGDALATAPNAVRAQALVLDGDSGMSGTTGWSSRAKLQVTIPGRDPVDVVHDCMVERGKELIRGFVVPVDVDPADPSHLVIAWDEVPTIQERVANRDPVIINPTPPPAADRTIAGWPPAHPLPHGRRTGTAWVIAMSEDAKNWWGGGDLYMPPGRTTYHFKGTVSFGPHSYLSWLLLRINPTQGEPYGAYLRTKVTRWHYHDVLPVSINPDDPQDIEFVWDASPSIARQIAQQIDTDLAETHQRVDTMRTVGADATAAAIINIADPTTRQQVADNMTKLGMIDAKAAAAAVAAPAPDALARLEKLHASGILTDAEFDAERAKLASGI